MDLAKTGKYIAQKRKALGLTQKQVAEKLGMSDKSVSKWERGICLPDVSVYEELCEILEISINEFLAGEDIQKENIEKKSEDNLIQIIKDSTCRQKFLKRWIAVLALAVFVAASVLGCMIFSYCTQPKNYIQPFDRDSAEMKTAQLLSGIDGAMLFRYCTKDEFKTLNLYMRKYQSGKLIEKTQVANLSYEDIQSPSEGILAMVLDFENFEVKLVISDDVSKVSTEIPILEQVKDREYYGRSWVQIEEKTPISYGKEQGLAGYIFGKDGLSSIPVETMAQGDVGTENDYVYYFTVQYGK